ncbi:hypothetical protein NADFUDRAFT_49711 [Nadsonia fulvescens var. elongata DSM 6958]|uniref:RING-type domain-containing protein n=1 Tax=Nadsonia fulvescens var. elongata DSM 6958 TaxID=857566 RepID=A0A1E3PPW0_9ASCO|nr:hypothetical protein NADFUDRAFT_49711 [Nadsonia fulvescens var. elongata DSM 6958]
MLGSLNAQFDASCLISDIDALLHRRKLPPLQDLQLSNILLIEDLSSGCVVCGELLYVPFIIVGNTYVAKRESTADKSEKEPQGTMETRGCGHYFCYDCLNSWFEKQSKTSDGNRFVSTSASHSIFSCPLCRYSITYKPIMFQWLRDTIADILDKRITDMGSVASLEAEIFAYKTKITERYYNNLMQYDDLFPGRGLLPRQTDLESLGVERDSDCDTETETEGNKKSESESEGEGEDELNTMFQDVLKDKKWVVYG